MSRALTCRSEAVGCSSQHLRLDVRWARPAPVASLLRFIAIRRPDGICQLQSGNRVAGVASGSKVLKGRASSVHPAGNAIDASAAAGSSNETLSLPGGRGCSSWAACCSPLPGCSSCTFDSRGSRRSTPTAPPKCCRRGTLLQRQPAAFAGGGQETSTTTPPSCRIRARRSHPACGRMWCTSAVLSRTR